jgi:UDP-glucose 4-epimerase
MNVMRIVVTGATGNVGTSVVGRLADDRAVDSILGLSRRVPRIRVEKTQWQACDVAVDDLTRAFRGADTVVHLAWLIQPSRDPDLMARTNLTGTSRVLRAIVEARVPSLVYASSVGAYSFGPKDRFVDESWPADGIATSIYSRHKVHVERLLDRFEAEQPHVRVVRLRKALVFKREASSEIRRLFLGPFFPSPLLRLRRLPIVPAMERLRFQAVHSRDAGDAYVRASVTDVRGAFNIAAEPVLDPPELARLLRGWPVPMPAGLLRAGLSLTWRLRLQPTGAGWLDLALGAPLMDTQRAKTTLGWVPRYTASQAFMELVDGLGRGAGIETPPLSVRAGGPLRLREIVRGIGSGAI